MRIFFIFLFLAFVGECIAQDTLEYRPKLVELSLESHSGYNATPKPSQNMNNLTRVKQDMALKMRFGVPVILNDKTTFAVQLKFDQQYYTTENSQNDLFNYLNSHELRNTGLTLFYQDKSVQDRVLTFALQTELASDRWELNGNSGRYLVNGNYMKALNAKTNIGFGGVINYALGVWNIYPTFSYKKQLSNKSLFEVFLPSKVGYRYHLNPKTYFIAETEFVNWRFNVTDPLENNLGDMALIRADVYFKFRVEKEIHDWLWFGVDTGFIHNVNYGLVEHGSRIANAIQEFNVKDAAFLRFWIFVLPPNKLWKSL
ncbi:MAG: hypothetical protein COW03_09830 [Cytophagales bacterium CG12_big_fil_rev_8_21_14_0_65_40_12]|nr:MAG: hypothetical protein COW03_09830 [Cytophagales bacterium CG12_big_fil_rev_8_21_14_0_65_40_12]PIW04628.1 MAG: hypothetical protein COW40_08955 [Cytophagales bacterium CG17_big_fil_post_rev_8_21_14_2_50_40_13]